MTTILPFFIATLYMYVMISLGYRFIRGFSEHRDIDDQDEAFLFLLVMSFVVLGVLRIMCHHYVCS